MQDLHNYGKIELDCCQNHRELYDRKYEIRDELLQDISEDEADNPLSVTEQESKSF